jgi:hypothetical protein
MLASLAARIEQEFADCDDDIRHEHLNSLHRVVVNDEPGEWVHFSAIARKGNVIATTDAFMGVLPELAILSPVNEGQHAKA